MLTVTLAQNSKVPYANEFPGKMYESKYNLKQIL